MWVDSTHDRDVGGVKKTGSTDSSVVTRARHLLDNHGGWTAAAPNILIAYKSPDHQDYLAVTFVTEPIPEAESYAFLALGMGLVGWPVRRRSSWTGRFAIVAFGY